LAPVLQKLPVMNSSRALFSLVALSLAGALAMTGAAAMADDGAAESPTRPACVEAYRQANADYYKKLAQLEGTRSATTAVGTVGVGGWVGCLWATKSLIGCTALGGGAVAMSAYYHHENTVEIRQLEDARRLYLIYAAYKSGEASDSIETREFLQDLGVDIQLEDQVLAEVARQMESGELCRSGSRPSTSYSDVMASMHDFERTLN
jgi:hypothetical protein